VSPQTEPRLCQPWIPQTRLTQPWHELVDAVCKWLNRYEYRQEFGQSSLIPTGDAQETSTQAGILQEETEIIEVNKLVASSPPLSFLCLLLFPCFPHH